MKIYIVKIDKRLMPKSQKIRFPKHNDDYGIEQDFLSFLESNQKYVTTNYEEADWCYLPIYWTRWKLNNDYGKKNNDFIDSAINNLKYQKNRTFTVCQYADGPGVPLDGVRIYLASRNKTNGFDVPLLCRPHSLNTSSYLTKFSKLFSTKPNNKKKYKASFRGRYSTHPIRGLMAKELKLFKNVLIKEKSVSSRAFAKEILQSEIALCPRGHGGDSFRFYEAMQLGVAPLFIGDIDTRPFKSQIDWNKCSFYTSSIEEVKFIINSYSKEELLKIGKKANEVYNSQLKFGMWCKCLIKELSLS